MSGEHVWPNWIRKLLPKSVLKADVTYVYEDIHGEFLRVPHQPIFKKKVRRACNNEWMGRREDAAELLITEGLFGRATDLDIEAQGTVAAWAALKALVAQLSFRRADPYGRIPSEHYRELYESRDQPLSEAWTVYTAQAAWTARCCKAGLLSPKWNRTRRKKRGQQDGYLLTFTVLDMVFQVLRLFGDAQGEFNHSPRLAPSVRRIWPPVEPFTWPPGPALTTAGILALAGGDDAIR